MIDWEAVRLAFIIAMFPGFLISIGEYGIQDKFMKLLIIFFGCFYLYVFIYHMFPERI